MKKPITLDDLKKDTPIDLYYDYLEPYSIQREGCFNYGELTLIPSEDRSTAGAVTENGETFEQSVYLHEFEGVVCRGSGSECLYKGKLPKKKKRVY